MDMLAKYRKAVDYYKDACNNIISLFAEHYEVSVGKDDWVGGEVGSTICINEEFYLGMDEIILMLNKDVSWNEFLRWWDYNLDAHFLNLNALNLRSWLNGCPRLSQEQIDELKKMRKDLDDIVETYKKKF